MVRISVVIPTVGRETLAAALESCAGADEIVVVHDDFNRSSFVYPRLPVNAKFGRVTGGDHGYSARAKGMELATGTHLCFLDDDDVFVDGAFDLMRAAACDKPVIFRMDHPSHGVLWRDKTLEFGNVGTPMFLVPNVPDKLGVWEPFAPGLPEPGGDFTFIAGCVERMGGPVWRDEVTSVIRPHERGPSITVVTPWWNHPELADDYLAAIEAANPAATIIYNNGDPLPIFAGPFVLGNDGVNVGFSAACNRGLDACGTDAVLFLNNDIVMTSRDWLTRIRAALEPGVLVGAQLRNDPHADVDGERMPYLDGWCVAGMRDDLLELGGWDESLEEPSYYGDNLLSLKARAAGMTLREVRVGLTHKLNVSANDHPNVAAASAANRERYLAAAREILEPIGV